MDTHTKQQRSYNMSRIRSSGTGLEKIVIRSLKKKGLHFSVNYRGVIGKPDIAVPSKKKAVFIHSDFWHGWQFPRWPNKLLNNFWKKKIISNRKRDKKVRKYLNRIGWKALVVWEHSLNVDFESTVDRIIKFIW
jgi:DNA mismatch endonuclease (patch repair protein)